MSVAAIHPAEMSIEDRDRRDRDLDDTAVMRRRYEDPPPPRQPSHGSIRDL